MRPDSPVTAGSIYEFKATVAKAVGEYSKAVSLFHSAALAFEASGGLEGAERCWRGVEASAGAQVVVVAKRREKTKEGG